MTYPTIDDTPMEEGEEVKKNLEFICCAAAGEVEKTKRFLSDGVNVDFKQDSGLTALHLAVKNGHYVVVAYLLESGADVNIRCECGLLPDDVPDFKDESNSVNVCICQWMVKHSRETQRASSLQCIHKFSRSGSTENSSTPEAKGEPELGEKSADCSHEYPTPASYLDRATKILQKYLKMSDSLVSAENTVKLLNKELSALTKECEKIKNENLSLKKDICLYKDRLVLSNVETKHVRETLSVVEAEHELLKKSLLSSTVDAPCMELERELEKLKEEVNALRQELDTSERNIDNIKSELTASHSNQQEVELELTRAVNREKKLKKELTFTQERLGETAEYLHDAQLQISEMETKLDEIYNENAALKKAAEEATVNNDPLMDDESLSRRQRFKISLSKLDQISKSSPHRKQVKTQDDGSFFSSASASFSDLAYSCESDNEVGQLRLGSTTKRIVHNDTLSDETTNASTSTIEKKELQMLQEKYDRLRCEFEDKVKQYDMLYAKYKIIKLARKRAREEFNKDQYRRGS